MYRFMNLIVVLTLALGIAWATPARVLAANDPPVQIFYVSLPETDALTVLDAINTAAASPMSTYFSIAIGVSGTKVYYDQWENGYDADIANPANLYSAGNLGGTQIWGNGEADDGCAPNIAGVAVTCTDANDVLNAGNVIIPYNAVAVTDSGSSYVLDDFNSSALNGDDGNVNWSSNWVETGDNGTAGGGDIRIDDTVSNQLSFTSADVNDSIDRGVNLASADACATLSFSLSQNNVDAGENFAVQMSGDGTTYITLETFTSTSLAGPKFYTLSPSYFTSTARVRFVVLGDALEDSEYYAVDDARVAWGCGTRSAAVILFDGKDKIGASSSVAMARATWASGSSTLNAFAHEMYATSEWGTEYEAPVGANTTNAGQMFEYSAISVMAAQNNTTVQVDANVDGIYGTFVLQEGGSRLIAGILQGARIISDKPVQVALVTGDVGSNYASRDMNLLPVSAYGSSYWSPVGVSTDNWPNSTAGPTRLYLYNPSAGGSIYITCERYGVGNTTQGPVAARGVVTVDLVDNQGAHCYASTSNGTATTDKIFAIGTVDTLNSAGDWSFTLFPDNFLSTDALVGLGLGQDPTTGTFTEDSSPLWVTSACSSGGTYVYVDWNNDGTADGIDTNGDGTAEAGSANGILVTRLQSLRLFRPTPRSDPYNQSGARVWSRTASGVGKGGTPGCNLALAWGQDPRTSTAGTPGLDVGTSIPPLRLIEGTKSLTVATDTAPVGVLNPGDVVYYNITVKNVGSGVVNNVYVKDSAPANTTYVANTTQKDVGSGWVSIPDAPGGVLPIDTPTGVLLGNLAANATFYVRFQVTLGTGSFEDLTNCSTTFTDAGQFGKCVTTPVATRDWGDLPDTFFTSAAADGPRHSYNGLVLGTAWDFEAQGVPSAAADGDDNTLSPDDEDGIVVHPSWNANGTLRVTVKATGGVGATLYNLAIWINWDKNGVFNTAPFTGPCVSGCGELYTVQITADGVNNVLNLGAPSGFTVVDPALEFRLRLYPTAPASYLPTGYIQGGEIEDYVYYFSPLAVDLASFAASAADGSVTLTWETVSETSHAGFNLYRGESAEGPWVKLNEALIPAATPGAAQGNLYTWTDGATTPGTHWYMLEDVDLNGTPTQHDPVSIEVTAPTAVDVQSFGAHVDLWAWLKALLGR